MDLSQFGIDTNGTGLSIPGLDGIQTALTTITIVSIIITGLFFVMYVFSLIRRWKVDRAILETQKDVRAIRTLLEQSQPKKSEALASTPARESQERSEGIRG